MAKTLFDAVFGASNHQLPSGSELALTEPTDNGLGKFEAVWNTKKGDIKGQVSSRNLEFTPDELQDHGIPVDSKGEALFRDLQVKYIGASNEVINTNDILIVRDLWVNNEQLECRCTNRTGAKPNSDGTVVVKCNLLERA